MAADPQNSLLKGSSQAVPRSERALVALLRLCTYSIVVLVGLIFLSIFIRGAAVVFTPEAPFINTEFLTASPETLHVYTPRDVGGGEPVLLSESAYSRMETKPSLEVYEYANYAHSAGGVGPAIVGTFLLVAGSIFIALLLGIVCAIYLSEYSPNSRGHNWIKLAVLNLSGVPSIVYGLFGFGLFVLFFGWGVSLLAGWFTLGLMALPTIIAASEEALRNVPNSHREGALALGASKWTSIRTCVLPNALPGILTSSIIGVARVAGETAPIMFTAAFAFRDQLPWEGLAHWTDFFFQGVMALPYHIYIVSSKLPQNEYTRDMQYGATFVFLLVIGLFVFSSMALRVRLQSRSDRAS